MEDRTSKRICTTGTRGEVQAIGLSSISTARQPISGLPPMSKPRPKSAHVKHQAPVRLGIVVKEYLSEVIKKQGTK
jgi:hypothetical protein